MTTWMLPAAARNIWLENCRSAMESLVMKRKDRCGISAISADLHGCTSGCRAPPEADARQRVKIHPQGENHAVLRRYCLDYRHCCRRPGLFRRCQDRKSTRLNSSHVAISYAVFCLKKKDKEYTG